MINLLTRMRCAVACAMLLAVGCGGAKRALNATGETMTPSAGAAPDSAWRTEIEAWRASREARLKSDTGWLTVAGLFWLKNGPNRFGSDETLEIPLPPGPDVPALAGVIGYHEGRARLVMQSGVQATLKGQPVIERDLASDDPGPPDEIEMGDLTFFVIHRDGREAIRLRDKKSRYRREFTGLKWYPLNEAYRVTARWVPSETPRTLDVPNILGFTEKMSSPGRAVFTLSGQEMSLEPVLNSPDDKELFFIFKDATAGKATYGAGRFLYTPLPSDGKVVLDFNRAYTPPCAFTPHATCPLPPPQNRLAVPIEAGELNYAAH